MENSRYPHLFTPIAVGSVTLPNRLMMGSMHTGLEYLDDGMERLAAFYGARAAGGAALIATGGFSPNAAGNLTAKRVEMSSAADAAAHRIIPRAVHDRGGRIVLQILHSGRYGYHDAIVAPSPLRAPINAATPGELDAAAIEATLDDYARCAALARDAGYDGVEVMGSEGYLIAEFLAPRVNRRDDEWGGAFENRMRFPLEIVRRIRARIGDDFLLVFRISALDLVEGGATGPELARLAGKLEIAGVDMFTTGIGWHEAKVPTIAQAVPRAGFAWAQAALSAAVGVPVAASNRINTPAIAEAVVASGQADIAMMARPFLADPDFVAKAAAGEPGAINICIACNQACLDHYFEGAPTSCLVNPRACHETKRVYRRTRTPRKIAVVGGGPAGLSCAATASACGHAVTLFEAEARLGGQFNLAARIPGKQEFAESVAYFAGELDRNGVAVRLGARADAAMLIAGGFDEIVLACGVVPRIPDIAGLDHPKLATYTDIVAGRREAGDSVAIIGGGGIAHDVALMLLEDGDAAFTDPAAFARRWGIDPTLESPGGLLEAPLAAAPPRRRIVMLKRGPGRFGGGLGKSTGWIHRAILARNGVEMLAGVAYERIDDDGLHITVDGAPRCLAVDTVILCAGQEPRRDLADVLNAAGRTVHLIGGAKNAAALDAKRAILEGLEAALGF